MNIPSTEAPPIPGTAVLTVERVDGTIVHVRLSDGTLRACARLRSAGALRPGDRALVDLQVGVVLGALDDGTPDELVIEAGRALTIRCGAGSIRLRHDGRVLIEGLDVVTRATRTNRITGGQVVVN